MKYGMAIGSIGQWLAAVLLLTGICVEVVTGADIGYILIACGSAVFAIATKVKYYRKREKK